MKIDFEIKFLIDDKKVVAIDGTLYEEFQTFFQIEKPPIKIDIMYWDTKDFALYQEGWTARIRKKHNRDDYEITYKQRAQVTESDIEREINKLDVKEIEKKNCEAQVDWGYDKKTLSVAYKDRVSSKKGNLMERKKAAICALLDRIPNIAEHPVNKKWGRKQMKRAKPMGPICCKRYEGMLAQMPVDIEIWPLKSQMICEVSFKTNEEQIAKIKRKEIMEMIEKKGILLHYDGLKTKLFIEEYES